MYILRKKKCQKIHRQHVELADRTSKKNWQKHKERRKDRKSKNLVLGIAKEYAILSARFYCCSKNSSGKTGQNGAKEV